ncbi:peptidase inhibitor family I36 protein [Streptomyces jietaisiensis]|uniref:peptidase inhibitor family I36 protein n=1 Tax=Streptomyces griseoaurantiacus TaxID=68213 RepID=UPI0032503A75
MKLKAKTALIGAALASAAVLAAPGTASADYASCASGKICFYDGPNGTGEVLQVDPVTNRNIGRAWNDRVSSIWNRSSFHLCTWNDDKLHGLNWIIEPGHKQEMWALYDNALTSYSVEIGFGCGA